MAVDSGGRVEQSPYDWINAVESCTRELAALSPSCWPPNICSITGQMHGLVLLGKDGEPLRDAMICSDFRAHKELAQIQAKLTPDYVLRTTGSPGIPILTGPKVLWLKNNEPHLYKQISKFILPKDYIGYVMTGEVATDPSDASGTMLYDCMLRTWDDALCAASAVSPGILPPVRPSTDIRGTVNKKFALNSGIPVGTPVIIGAGDLSTTALGTGVMANTDVGISLGTAGIVFRLANQFQEGLLGKVFYFCHGLPEPLINIGSCPGTGFSVGWFENQILNAKKGTAKRVGKIDRSPISETPSLIFLPFLLGTGSPYMDYNSQGAFIGLSYQHMQKDLRRAIYEGISYSLRQSFELLQVNQFRAERVVVCAGGSHNKDWLQILSNIIGLPIWTLQHKDTAVIGAAILGGLAAGWFNELEDGITKFVKLDKQIHPQKESIGFYEQGFSKYIKLCTMFETLRGEIH